MKDLAKFISAALVALGGISALAKLGWTGAIIVGIAALITVGVDIIMALYAPTDPIIGDSFGLSLVDLATLTSANAPVGDPRTFKTENDIVVNVNKTIPPLKLPLEYHETREHLSEDQDSRYEITYRFNRVAQHQNARFLRLPRLTTLGEKPGPTNTTYYSMLQQRSIASRTCPTGKDWVSSPNSKRMIS